MIPDGAAIFGGLVPELVLVGAGCLVLLVALFARPESQAGWFVAVVAMLVALGCSLGAAQSLPAACPWLNCDPLAWYARIAAISIGLLVLLATRHVPAPGEGAEFSALLLFSFAGVSLVALANDLVLLFLALELVSVPTYVLVGLSRRDVRAQEATGKYFFLGALAAAITLYGFSFLYGAAGTTTLFSGGPHEASIAQVLELPSHAMDRLTILGLLLTLVGLSFKLAAVPLYFYVADVYQGAASPVTGMLGFVPKFAGILALVRVLSLFGWHHSDAFFWLLWALAATTMIAGNTLALMQNNVKRMLAYSSVAHSGYILVGILAGQSSIDSSLPLVASGVGAALFYIVVYGIMNLGAFAVLAYFRKADGDENDSAETLEDLAGAARAHPWASLAMAIFVLGLMGLPPTGGFFAKLYVFSAALSQQTMPARQGPLLAIVIIGVINSAIAAAYYLRIVAACYIRSAAPPGGERLRPQTCQTLRLCIAACAIFLVALFVRPIGLMVRSRVAASDLTATSVRSATGHTADAGASQP